MSLLRSGKGMRSRSRRPWLSNRQSSTLLALAENSAKFVPRPSQVAPSGCGAPAESRALALGNEKNCSKRWNDKADLGDGSLLQRIHAPAVPHIVATVDVRIRIEHLAPEACEGHPNAVVAVDFRREIHHHEAPVMHIAPLAQPGKYAAVAIMHDQPLEPRRLTVELGKCRDVAVEVIEVAHQRLDASMLRLFQEIPIERMIVPPLMLLSELAAHEQELLAGVAEHKAVIGAQIGKPLPGVARHAAKNRALAVHNLVVRQRQDEVLGEGVVQPEQDLAVVIAAIDRILAAVVEGFVHPPHVPFVTEAEPAMLDRP